MDFGKHCLLGIQIHLFMKPKNGPFGRPPHLLAVDPKVVWIMPLIDGTGNNNILPVVMDPKKKVLEPVL
jgi:hypothetical protein